MLILVWFAGCAALAVLLPHLMIARPPGRFAVLKASLAAWIAGGVFVGAGAWAISELGGRDFKTEFEAGINGWKLMLLLAPAVAIHLSRRRAAEG